jgi:hypothetical protein
MSGVNPAFLFCNKAASFDAALLHEQSSLREVS